MQRQMDFKRLRGEAQKFSCKAKDNARGNAPARQTRSFRIAALLLASSALTSVAFAEGNPAAPAQVSTLTSPVSQSQNGTAKAESDSAPVANQAQAPSADKTPAADKAAAAVSNDKAAASTKDDVDAEPTASIFDKALSSEKPSAGGLDDPEPAVVAPAMKPDAEPTIKETKVPSASAEAVASAGNLPALVQKTLEALVAADAKGQRAAIERNHVEIAAFYTARNFVPVWTESGKVTELARSVMDRLRHASEDGLDTFALPDLVAGSDEDKAKADIAFSEAVVRYGQEASGDRVDPRSISQLIGAKPDVAEAFDILSTVAAAGNKGGDVLWAFNPPQKSYVALRQKLAELRRENPGIAQHIPLGPELSVGMRDPRVSLIRSRFGLDGKPVGETTADADLIYDTKVAAAVADFQKSKGLPVSGVLTAKTIAALSGGQPSRLENEILANMERWRWMPREMGDTYIAVNIPDFTVSVIRDDQVLTRHRVVVGKPETPTPVFSKDMKYLIVNPYWNVPQSIIKKEFMPKTGGNVGAMAEHGYEVSARDGHYVVRQPPGEKNALGRIKFLFPNDYAVYLHDTPSKALFATTKRSYSHGCVRVDQPFSFAATILGAKYSEERLKAMIGPNEKYINLPVPLPVHIEYFTTYVDESGRLQMRDDLYGYSHKVKMALGLER